MVEWYMSLSQEERTALASDPTKHEIVGVKNNTETLEVRQATTTAWTKHADAIRWTCSSCGITTSQRLPATKLHSKPLGQLYHQILNPGLFTWLFSVDGECPSVKCFTWCVNHIWTLDVPENAVSHIESTCLGRIGNLLCRNRKIWNVLCTFWYAAYLARGFCSEWLFPSECWRLQFANIDISSAEQGTWYWYVSSLKLWESIAVLTNPAFVPLSYSTKCDGNPISSSLYRKLDCCIFIKDNRDLLIGNCIFASRYVDELFKLLKWQLHSWSCYKV